MDLSIYVCMLVNLCCKIYVDIERSESSVLRTYQALSRYSKKSCKLKSAHAQALESLPQVLNYQERKTYCLSLTTYPRPQTTEGHVIQTCSVKAPP